MSSMAAGNSVKLEVRTNRTWRATLRSQPLQTARRYSANFRAYEDSVPRCPTHDVWSSPIERTQWEISDSYLFLRLKLA